MPNPDYSYNLRHFSGKENFDRLKPALNLSTISGKTKLYRPISKNNDSAFYRNDWASMAFRCFLEFNSRFTQNIDSFLSIGTGSGLETLAAIEALNPTNVTICDLDISTVRHAKWNIENLVLKPQPFNIKIVESEYFKGFEEETYDLIYENLPNLPFELSSSEQDSNQPIRASFAVKDEYDFVPKKYRDNLLFSHYIFLSQAKKFLNKGGGVICLIGARATIADILEMFSSLAYEPHVLVYDVKMQNEIESNLVGYKQAEEMNKTRFKFYRNSEVTKLFEENGHYDKISGLASIIKEISPTMESISMSATDAVNLYKTQHIKIGHEVLGVYATVKQ